MPESKVSWFVVCIGLSKAILHDRPMRRKFIGYLLAGALGMMAIGLWAIDGWLRDEVVRFTIWWGICAVLTGFVLLFALYDALAVIKEEREKFDR